MRNQKKNDPKRIQYLPESNVNFVFVTNKARAIRRNIAEQPKSKNELEAAAAFEYDAQRLIIRSYPLEQIDRFLIFLNQISPTPDAIIIDMTTIKECEIGDEFIKTIKEKRENNLIKNYLTIQNFETISTHSQEASIITKNRHEKLLNKIPLILFNDDPSLAQGNFYHFFAENNFDGCIFSPTDQLDYLNKSDIYLSIWQMQARARLWNILLDRTALNLTAAKDIDAVNAVLAATFHFMEFFLDIEYCFVRTKLDEKNYVCEHAYNANWTKENQTTSLDDLPLVAATIKAGEVERDMVPAPEHGIYDALKGRAMIGFHLQLFGETFGTLTVFRKEKFSPGDKKFLKRLSEKIAAVYGRQRIIENRKMEQYVAKSFAEQAANAHDEGQLCQYLAEAVYTCLYANILTKQKLRNNNTELNISEEAKVTVRLVPLKDLVLKCYAAMPAVENLEEAHPPIPFTENITLSTTNNTTPNQPTESKESICLKTFRTGIPSLYNSKDELIKNNYIGRKGFNAGCELCVPLTVTNPSSRPGVIGVINTEYKKEYFYTSDMQQFMETLAKITTTTILRIRQNKALKSLSEFIALEKHNKNETKLIGTLDSTITSFTGHVLFVHLTRPERGLKVIETPWTIKTVIFRNQFRANRDLKKWQMHFDTHWDETFTKKSISDLIDLCMENSEVKYTDNENEIKKTTELLDGHDNDVVAAAIVPVFNPVDGILTGVWLLEWFNKPALDRENLKPLLDFARYMSNIEINSEREKAPSSLTHTLPPNTRSSGFEDGETG